MGNSYVDGGRDCVFTATSEGTPGDSGSWKGPPEGVVQPHLFFFLNYIYLFLVALGLCCCVRAFSSFRGGYSHRGGISCSTAQALEGSLHSRDALG